MAKKLRLDVEINAVVNASAEKLDKVAKEMAQIEMGKTPGTTKKEIDEYHRISKEIADLKDAMERDLREGVSQTPASLEAYNTALDAQEKALREVTNQSMIALAGDKEFEDQLKESTSQIDAYEQSLKKAAVELEALKTQTEQVTKAEERAAKKLGISVSSIDTDDKIQEEINKRSTDGGRAKKNEKENIEVLQKILDLKQKLVESEGNILQDKEKVVNKMREEEALLSNEKEMRETIMLKQVELMKKKEGKGKNATSKITQEQAAQITSNIKLGRSFDEVRKSVKGVTLRKLKSEIEGNTHATRAATNANDKKKKTFFENVTAATLYYAAIRTLRRLMRQTVRTITELDKSFTQIAMVTGMTRKES
jgi:DNA repair exonuclease SbcCD ATPase subunit